MKTLIRAAYLLALLLPFTMAAQSQQKCEASINGYRIHTVYITGSHYNGVVWAYKHLGEETCLIPVEDATKADAILDIRPVIEAQIRDRSDDEPITVSCFSGHGSSTCTDSQGNELNIDCDRNGNCSSYYGPSVGSALHSLIGEWIRSAWYQSEARLYTPDRKILWKSDSYKGASWHDLWPDKLREASGSPACKRGAWSTKRYRNYRQWASENCAIAFDPFVSIDIKANARLASKAEQANRKQAEMEEMKKNAQEAAAAQSKAPL